MRLEKLLVGLRRKEGVSLHEVTQGLSEAQRDIFLKKIVVLKKKKLIREHDAMLSLTMRGMMLENQILIELITEYN